MKTEPGPSQTARCPRCGAESLLNASEKLCSACLLESALKGFDGPELADTLPDGPAPSGLSRLGDYDLIEELARGGMGVVYRARQRGLGRVVALKLILVGRWAGTGQVQRFKAEAAAAARLDHPNIVPIHEIGEEAGQHFFSMKLIEGRSLAQAMASTAPRLPPRDAVRLLVKIARAVHYAHQRGVLHRDLKPSNILLDATGEPHLTDFGLAKIFQHETSTTLSAEFLGTPAYMAPEQAGGKGAQVTVAADIYSLGAIMYELLTGATPFTGGSPLEILEAARAGAPEPLRHRNPVVPRDLELICLKCLRTDPAHRYGSTEALADDLDRWLAGEPIHARPVPAVERLWLWTRRKPVVAGLTAALIVLVIATAVFSTSMAWRIAQERDRAEALTKANQRQLVELDLANGLRLVSGGDYFGSLPWLVEALRRDENNSRSAREDRVRLATLLRELPRPQQIWFHDLPVADAAFSPDEMLVATAAGNKAFLWDVRSGDQRFPPLEHPMIFTDVERQLQGSSVSQLAFGPDGQVLLCVCGAYAQLWNAQSGQRIGQPLTHDFRIHHALFTADGREVLTAGEDGKVKRWSAETGAALGAPLVVGSPVYRLASSPQSSHLIVASVREATRIWRMDTWNPTGEPMVHFWAVFDACFSPDGRVVATAGGDSRARLWNADSGAPVGRVFWHKDEVHQVLFSPDGKRLVSLGRDQTAKIWLLADDTIEPVVLNHGGAVRKAAFSPDGQWLATASANGLARVWDVEDGRPIMPPLPHNDEVVNLAFSRDGRRLLTASADGTARVWRLPTSTATHRLFRDSWWLMNPPCLNQSGRFAVLMDVDGAALVWDLASERGVSPELKHPKPAFLGCVSDDGQLAVTACHDGNVRIWQVASGELLGEPIPFTARSFVTLSPDKRLLAMADGWGVTRVWDLQQRAIIAEFAAPAQPPRCAAFAPGGRQLVIGAGDRTVRVYDIDSRQEVARLNHDAPVVSVKFNREGTRIASGDESGQAIVWQIADAKPIGRVNHGRRINSLAFSPDGRRLLTGGEDGSARLWDVASGQPLLPPIHHTSPIRCLTFSPDGAQAVTVDARLSPQFWELDSGHPLTPARQYHLRPETNAPASFAGLLDDWNWKLPADDRPLETLQREALLLSGREVDATGDLVPVSRDRLRDAWLKLRPVDGE